MHASDGGGARLEYLRTATCSEVEPMTGIEPAYSAWEVDSRCPGTSLHIRCNLRPAEARPDVSTAVHVRRSGLWHRRDTGPVMSTYSIRTSRLGRLLRLAALRVTRSGRWWRWQ